MSNMKTPTQCPHKSKIRAFPPKGIISLQYLNHAPHIESTEKKNTAIDQPTPRRTHTNPVSTPDSKSLQASVAGTRFVTFKRGDGSALVHPPHHTPRGISHVGTLFNAFLHDDFKVLNCQCSRN